jgi:DNA-binding response OmpR family regulator
LSDGMLIVCGQRNLGEHLLNMIASTIPGRHVTALSGADARRRTSLSEFSAVLIAGRLPDDTSIDLALDLTHKGCSVVMVITERDELFDTHDALDGTGVTILSKPLSKDALLQAVKLILKVTEGGGTLEKAKLMLVAHKNFTEPQAHRYIQKLSMDKRLPREVAAQYVIKGIEREQSGN